MVNGQRSAFHDAGRPFFHSLISKLRISVADNELGGWRKAIVRFHFLYLTLSKLTVLTDEILSRQMDIIYIEIGYNKLCRVAPFVLADGSV